jgi:hypothetical protein
MIRGYQLPHAGMAETFCFFADPYSFGILTQQKVSKNASFHKAIASIVHSRPPHSFRVPSLLALSCSTLQGRSVMRFSIAHGEDDF